MRFFIPDCNAPAPGSPGYRGTVPVYIGIGSNIDPYLEIALGLEQLVRTFGPLRISQAYRSAAVGFDGPDFINLVVGFTTALPLDTVIRRVRSIEDQRETRDPTSAKAPCGSRRLDLDVLLYGEFCGVCQGKELPRSDITRYAHAARPLADIAGTRLHPVSGVTFREISDRLASLQLLELVSIPGAIFSNNSHGDYFRERAAT